MAATSGNFLAGALKELGWSYTKLIADRRVDGRAERWDARPVLTTRDGATLRFVGEQYAVRTDVLAVVLGRLSPAMPQAPGMLGVRTLRQRLGRWQEAGWVERRRMLGHTWVLPTRAGLRLAGLEFDCWEPAESRLAHHHAVALVRLAREALPGQGGWVCERELWRRRGRASWHMVDGALPVPVPAGWQGIDQAWELVEVELHQKARPRLVAAAYRHHHLLRPRRLASDPLRAARHGGAGAGRPPRGPR
jgi:hypothetical protein